jgi:ABC-2 type transport system permease protein
MNIFLRELKANLKSLLIWTVIVLLLTVIGFAKFEAYEGNPELVAILDSMPAPIVEALSLNAFNLTTITGFYGVFFQYFALILSIAAAMWGSDVISKEERDKTVEFSLTLPVTRSRVVTAKALAALVHCIGLLLITWALVLFNATRFQTDSQFYAFVSRSVVALFIMQMIFLAVGIFLGCAMKRYKRVGSVAISLLLGSYILSIISTLDPDLDFLHFFTPFGYFDPGTLMRETSFDLTYVWISAGIVVVLMIAAYLSYARRDMYI